MTSSTSLPGKCLYAAATLVFLACATGASAEQRFTGAYGAVVLVVGDGWRQDSSAGDLTIECEKTVCGRWLWCQAAVDNEKFPNVTREQYLRNSPAIIDNAFRGAAPADQNFLPTLRFQPRRIGANDGFYGEYDVQIKSANMSLKLAFFQTLNKYRVVNVVCMSHPKDFQEIQKIVRKLMLPA